MLSDESDEGWYDEVEDTGSVCSCDSSDEDWTPEEHEDSDDESADFFQYLAVVINNSKLRSANHPVVRIMLRLIHIFLCH